MNWPEKYIKMLFVCMGILLLAHTVKAQMSVLDTLAKRFNHYSQRAFQEKLYLHTDRSFYMSGEIMWFKIYYVDGMMHRPQGLSKVAYVEVLDTANQAIVQGKVALQEGKGSGSFYLPVSVTSGNYKLRAYTSWMKNFSPDFYFEQPITIVSPFTKLNLPPLEAAHKYDIQFFPEGGNLVEGIESKVAFKAVNQKGKGIDFKGMLIDQHNDTVLHFQPYKFGMGHFVFTPSAEKKYRAIVTMGDSSYTKTLPRVYAEGYVMHVEESGQGQLSVSIQVKKGNDFPFVYLLAHTRQMLKVAQMITLREGKATVKIDESTLGKGISHFTLFNSEQQPVCERLYFRPPSRELNIEAVTDQPHYATRENVSVTINTKKNSSAPVQANLSVSVYQKDSLALFSPADIRAYYWLTSDLKGTIESPGYYLNNTAESRKAADHLMLTQGWRRFDWEKVLLAEKTGFDFLPEHEGPIISAKVKNKITGESPYRLRTYLSVPGINFHFYTNTTDGAGRVRFITKNIYGTSPILIQTNTAEDSTYRYEILPPFSQEFTEGALPAFDFSSDISERMQVRSRNMQVQNVFLEDTLNTFTLPQVDSMPFYGIPDRTFLLDDYTRFPTMEEVMREYVQGVGVRKQKGKFHFKILYEATNDFFQNDPLILLDGMPIFDTNKAIALEPLKIKKLDVIRQKFYLGSKSFSGILSYTTYDHDLSWYQIDPHALQVEYEGLQRQREFYTPAYETEQQIHGRMPDFRTLLHWSPEVDTNPSGETEVNFYTSDQPGTYIGIIHGMTDAGEMGSTSFTFEVNPRIVH